MDDSQLNKQLKETINNLLPFFSKLYFFNKLHRIRESPVLKPQGKIKKLQAGDIVCLGAEEFSVLWLIESIIESVDKKPIEINNKETFCCDRSLLEQFFLWRKSPRNDQALNTFNNKFKSIIRKLQATEMIDYEDDEENKKKHLLYLTDKGVELLRDLKEERAGQLAGILTQSTIKPNEYKRLEEEFFNMAERSWNILRQQAKNIKLKPDENENS